MVFGLIAAVVLARGSLIKAIAMVCFGILLGLIGTDVNSGAIRFAFGQVELADGLGFVALAMAFFGITDVVLNLEHKEAQQVFTSRIGSVLPTLADLRACFWSIARGTALGSLLGVLPGGGALLASFAAYMAEKKIAKPPRAFGEGDIRGVAAPESANNAGAQTSFIPMLTLGIPSNPTMALMIGALMIQGIAPGPQVMTERPELFWGLIASMWIGNLMLLVLNLPLVGVWIKLLAVPYRLLFPAIFVFCCIGAYAVDNKIFDVYALAALSALGYVLLKLDCEPAPMVLGFILGPMMEENLRRAMMISFGDPTVLITRPISAGFLLAALALLLAIALPALRPSAKRRCRSEPGGLMVGRRFELGGEPLGARIGAGEKADERTRRFRHRAVRHQGALVAGRDLQQLRHRTGECQPLALRDFADVIQAHLYLALGDEFLACRLRGNDPEPRFQCVEDAGLDEDAFRLFPALIG